MLLGGAALLRRALLRGSQGHQNVVWVGGQQRHGLCLALGVERRCWQLDLLVLHSGVGASALEALAACPVVRGPERVLGRWLARAGAVALELVKDGGRIELLRRVKLVWLTNIDAAGVGDGFGQHGVSGAPARQLVEKGGGGRNVDGVVDGQGFGERCDGLGGGCSVEKVCEEGEFEALDKVHVVDAAGVVAACLQPRRVLGKVVELVVLANAQCNVVEVVEQLGGCFAGVCRDAANILWMEGMLAYIGLGLEEPDERHLVVVHVVQGRAVESGQQVVNVLFVLGVCWFIRSCWFTRICWFTHVFWFTHICWWIFGKKTGSVEMELGCNAVGLPRPGPAAPLLTRGDTAKVSGAWPLQRGPRPARE